MGDKLEEFTVYANVSDDTAFRRGAKVVIIHQTGDNERVFCEGLSKGGRTIRKWIGLKRLRDFRVAFVHNSIKRRVPAYSREHAIQIADRCIVGGLNG